MSLAGTHVAKAVETKLGYASTGTEQVAIAFQITEGEHKGQSIVAYMYFSDKAAPRTLESLRACGWTGDDLSDLSSVGSRECEIVVEQEPDQQGVLRDRVRWVNALGAGRVQMKTEMSPQQARAFGARFKAMASSVRPLPPADPRAAKAAPARPASAHERAKTNGYQPQGDTYEPTPEELGDPPF